MGQGALSVSTEIAIFVGQTRLNIARMIQPDLFPNDIIQVSLRNITTLDLPGTEEERILKK